MLDVGSGNGNLGRGGGVQVGRGSPGEHGHGPEAGAGQQRLVGLAETVGVQDGVTHRVDGDQNAGEYDVHRPVYLHAVVRQVEEDAKGDARHEVHRHQLDDAVLQAAHLLVVHRLHLLGEARDDEVT